jgi:dihydrofolate synthase/folylpolyglutamate synthase
VAQALGISDAAIIRGLETTEHPGRLELISTKPPFLLDGAHNPAGARALRVYLDEFDHGPLTLIFGAMSNKRLDQITEILFPLADHLILTPVNNPRAAPVETLRSFADRFCRGSVTESSSSAAAVRTAIAQTPNDGLICVTGSLYLIGETRPMILKLAKERL